MLRSIRSAPASAAIAAASRMTPASWPKSWIETGCSSGWIRRNSRDGALVAVREAEAGDHLGGDQPGAEAARLEADEPVADAGQRGQHEPVLERAAAEGVQGSVRAAHQRVAEKPVAARASVRRRAARSQRSLRCAPRSASGRSGSAGRRPRRPGRRRARSRRVATRGDRRGLLAQLLAQPAHDPVDLAGVAVDHAGLDRLLRRPCRSRAGAPRCPPAAAAPLAAASASNEISIPGEITPPRYSPAPETTS